MTAPAFYPSDAILSNWAERDCNAPRGCNLAHSITCSGSSSARTLDGWWVLETIWDYVGLRIELNVNGETVLTAPIFSISVCPMALPVSA